MVAVVVFDAFGAQGFDAGVSRAEISEWLSLVLQASLIDVLGGHLGSPHVGVVAAFHFKTDCF
jgi:hypothetical protein